MSPPEIRRGAGPTLLVFQPLGRRRGNWPTPTAGNCLKIKTVFQKEVPDQLPAAKHGQEAWQRHKEPDGGNGGKQRRVLPGYWDCPSTPAEGTGG